MLSDLSLAGTEAVFWGKVHWSLPREGWLSDFFFFNTNTWWVKSFLPVTDTVFREEMWWRLGRTGGRTDPSPCITAVFFSSYKVPKTVTVTTLLLFGHVTLLYGIFIFILLSEGPRAHTLRCRLIIHTSLVRQCCASDTTGGWGELAQNPCTLRAVWMGLYSPRETLLLNCMRYSLI